MNTQKFVSQIKDLNLKQQVELYFAAMNIVPKSWQIEDIIMMFRAFKTSGSALLRYQRGFSKTFLCSHFMAFCALYDLRSIYLVPTQDQLDQLDIYLENNPFVDNAGKGRKRKNDWYYVNGKPLIKIGIMNENHVRSGRFNIIVFDEVAMLVKDQRKESLIDEAGKMQNSMSPILTIYASTPTIGSRFEKKEQYLRQNENITGKVVSFRNFQNTPDNFVTDTPEKLKRIMDELDELKQLGLEWKWRQEQLAEYVNIDAKAFNNVIIEHNIISKEPTHLGLDLHGDETGHIAVALHYNSTDSKNDVFVLNEECFNYPKLATVDESLTFLKYDYYKNIPNKAVETYGFNYGFWREAQKYGVKGVDIGSGKKNNLVYNALQFKIHINPEQTPHTFNDLRMAFWDDVNLYKLHKEKSGLVYRNHYLDALLNGMPLLRNTEIKIGFINNNNSEINNILQKEFKREKEYRRAIRR